MTENWVSYNTKFLEAFFALYDGRIDIVFANNHRIHGVVSWEGERDNEIDVQEIIWPIREEFFFNEHRQRLFRLLVEHQLIDFGSIRMPEAVLYQKLLALGMTQEEIADGLDFSFSLDIKMIDDIETADEMNDMFYIDLMGE